MLKLMNEEYRILTAKTEDAHEKLYGHTCVFYISSRDVIVVSTKCPDTAEVLVKLIGDYMSLDFKARKVCVEHLGHSRVDRDVYGILQAVNRIARIRRKVSQHHKTAS